MLLTLKTPPYLCQIKLCESLFIKFRFYLIFYSASMSQLTEIEVTGLNSFLLTLVFVVTLCQLLSLSGFSIVTRKQPHTHLDTGHASDCGETFSEMSHQNKCVG